MRSIAFFLFFFVVAVTASACLEDAGDSRGVGTTDIVTPVEYGNGVYYFRATDARFANSLVRFLKDHPGAEVMAMTGDGSHGHGYNLGHFVVIRLKPEKE